MASCRGWGLGEGTETPGDLGKATVCLAVAGPQRRRRLLQPSSRTLVSWRLSARRPLWVALSASPLSVFGSSCFFGSHKLFGACFLFLSTCGHAPLVLCVSVSPPALSVRVCVLHTHVCLSPVQALGTRSGSVSLPSPHPLDS